MSKIIVKLRQDMNRKNYFLKLDGELAHTVWEQIPQKSLPWTIQYLLNSHLEGINQVEIETNGIDNFIEHIADEEPFK